jgi:uncharacterized protein
MATDNLPNFIHPSKLARQNGCLKGAVPSDQMSRLRPLLVADLEPVELIVQGGVDAEGYSYVRCVFTAMLKLKCQRCLRSVEHKADVDSWLVPVDNELDGGQLPEHYDPLVTNDKLASLSDMVEDELLLSLPVVPRHDFGKCPVAMPESLQQEPEEEKSERIKPFADLKQRIKANDQEE